MTTATQRTRKYYLPIDGGRVLYDLTFSYGPRSHDGQREAFLDDVEVKSISLELPLHNYVTFVNAKGETQISAEKCAILERILRQTFEDDDATFWDAAFN